MLQKSTKEHLYVALANKEALTDMVRQVELVDEIILTAGSKCDTETFVLDEQAIANQSVELSNTPSDPTNVQVLVSGGTLQAYGLDFTISGKTVTWLGLGLETILGVGDILSVTYVYQLE